MLRRITRHRGLLRCLLGAMTLTACTSWRMEQVTPEQLFAGKPPKMVRVEGPDGRKIVMGRPHLVLDSLVGTIRGQRSTTPLANITHISVRRGNGLKTTGLVIGIIVVGPVAICGLACLAYVASGGHTCTYR